jgi:sulfoxide reductase catalytic subunit YedY
MHPAYRPMEQRVYRFRCVEAWSMVIPWDGYPLSRADQVHGPAAEREVCAVHLAGGLASDGAAQRDRWPYSEGLRMDEAMNPLTLLTFGSYGETLANQQGAPIRVIVPWKYGFKSAKSIVKIKFTDKMPRRRGMSWRR